MKISILTPSIRAEGLELVNIALKRQTFKDFEWLVGSPFESKYGTWVKDDYKGGFWSLNRIYNKLIKQASGDIIVSLQDHTLLTPQALSKFIYYMEKDPTAIITGAGDKYESVYPLLGAKTWTDPRRKGNTTLYKVPFNEIEFNFCALPKKALYDVGGFDEILDFMGFGMDGYSVMDRLNMLGTYSFYMDETNESYSMGHGRVPNWEKDNLIHGGYNERRKQYFNTPKLNYI